MVDPANESSWIERADAASESATSERTAEINKLKKELRQAAAREQAAEMRFDSEKQRLIAKFKKQKAKLKKKKKKPFHKRLLGALGKLGYKIYRKFEGLEKLEFAPDFKYDNRSTSMYVTTGDKVYEIKGVDYESIGKYFEELDLVVEQSIDHLVGIDEPDDDDDDIDEDELLEQMLSGGLK